MTGDALYLARTVSVRPFHDDPASSIEVVWGEGSERQSFVTESAQLASALATAPLETTLDDEVQRLAEVLAVEATDAADLVAGLRAHGLYRDQPDDLSAAEERWLDVAWADALDLHLATRNAIWSHDYSGNPKVMTRYFVDRSVEPETEAPPRYPVPEGESVPLPESKPLSGDYDTIQANRRTSRNFRGASLDLADVATILDWTYSPHWGASSSNLYVTQTYSVGAPFVAFVLFAGDGAPSKVRQDFAMYQHDPIGRRLVYLRSAEITAWSELQWTQEYTESAPMLMLICVDWAQYHWKYRAPRGYRFALTECGAFMQTALTVATGLGIRTFQSPAIDDARLSDLIGAADADLGPIYMAAFGRPPAGR